MRSVALDRAGQSSSRRSGKLRTSIPTAAFPIPPRRWSTPSAKRISRKLAHISKSSYFLTFTYLPPAEDAARAESWLYEGREQVGPSTPTR